MYNSDHTNNIDKNVNLLINHLEALFSIGLNCRGASEEIVKGKYLEPSSMSKPPSRTSHVSIIKIFEKKELSDDDGFFGESQGSCVESR